MLVALAEVDGKKIMTIVLQEENLRRMAKGDPVSFSLKNYLPDAPVIEVLIGSASDADIGGLKPEDLIRHIARGCGSRKTTEWNHADAGR